MEIKLIAEDVATMKEKSDNGLKTRRWIKVNIEELRKALSLTDWIEVNPREQNLKSRPAKEMKKSLTEDSRDIFHFLNRGISISAKECIVKPIADKKEVIIKFESKDEHGLFDGAHSFKVLEEVINNKTAIGDKHVMLEVFVGVEDILFDLARSRNTSTQVKEKSLANLEGKFDFIKDGLKKEPFFNNIAWRENDKGDISISYIIQILTAFNKDLKDKSMIKTYSGSGACETSFIREFEQNIENNQKENIYYKMINIYPDIFKFVDHVLYNFPIIYNKNGYESERGNFGKLKGITYKLDYFQLLFSDGIKKTSYKIPNSLFFPILAAMRQLYKENEEGIFEWIIKPNDAFDKLSEKIVTKIMGYYFDKQGAVNEVGKSLNLWIDVYEIVNSYLNDYLKEEEINRLREQLAMLEA